MRERKVEPRVASLYGPEEEWKAIWVFLEQSGGVLERVSLELLSHGRRLADEVASLAEEAFAYGADEVRLADHPLLDHFTVEGYAHVAFQAIMEARPSIVLFGATVNGRDLAGRLAVRLRTGLNADCTDLRLHPETGVMISEVSGFGGHVLALIEIPTHRPQMATVRPGVFPLREPEPARRGRVVPLPVGLTEDRIRTRVVERVVGEGVDLTQASVVVMGGRGVRGNFGMLRELAELLGGEVGATRPPVDEGHIGRDRQIGQTGVICRPKVAFVCGASGAFHLVVGFQEAETVIAVNSDPEAPIFDAADYCVVGDLLQIVPALIEALRPQEEVACE